MRMKAFVTGAALVAALGLAAPGLADVKAGYDAWGQGDYAKAVKEWQPLAEAGDPDAQYNMGQAYRAGQGVDKDEAAAVEWFRKAAEQGLPKAEDTYGRSLFQAGKRAEAMPWIQKSAARGEPRAQYILGTALFNGEFVSKDWVRAYALMTRASAAGLQPASNSLSQMNSYIPVEQRQKGLAMAAELEKSDKAAALAAAEVDNKATKATGKATVVKPTAKPKPVEVAQAEAPAKVAAPSPEPKAAPKPAPAKPAPKAGVPAPQPGGAWRVQMGAFSEDGRAQALWKSLSAKVGGLSGYQSFYVKGGPVTRLQAGPLASSADAEKLCRAIKAAGTDCIPKKM
ncbi:SPOR domain-containing protein [Sphingobium phenoxybenzoativorans]|uniref:SPOR domain-containing protein n=1 Tax=Sphingobium phenoxybenzoativorans TaxID=1592790 RepID=UPI001112D313